MSAGMVNGMATKKVTVTLDQGQLDRIRALAESGTAPSVSGFVQHAVELALDDVAGWGALLAGALRDTGGAVTVPATALAQAIRRRERQVRLARLIRQPATDVVPLDRIDATSTGRLLAASGTADIADAHVVICARRAGQGIVTSDPGDLRKLDPGARLIPL